MVSPVSESACPRENPARSLRTAFELRCSAFALRDREGPWLAKRVETNSDGTAELRNYGTVTGGVRQKLDEKWGKCGMGGVPLWGWLMNPNVGRVADEKSRIEAVRCANWAIRTMMRMKVAKEEVHPGGDAGRAEGSCGETGGKLDELPDPGNERGTRGGRRAKKSPEGGEVCFLAQKVDEMEMRKEAASTKDGRVKLELERLLQKQSGGVLWVEYGRARGGEGRWYARGNAQLQSCKRETRHMQPSGEWGGRWTSGRRTQRCCWQEQRRSARGSGSGPI